MVRAFFWICQPLKRVPAYSMVSLKRGTRAFYGIVGGGLYSAVLREFPARSATDSDRPPDDESREQPRFPFDSARDWWAAAAILGLFAVGWLLVGPRANVPVIDDWVYAWSVEHLLQTGRLQVLEFSAIYPIAQILWGALFARVAGFSFGVLRLSTLALAATGCAAAYATLRELGCRRSTSLLGAFALALDPVVFAMSFSFMTEVPFNAFSLLALYWYIRAIRRDERTALWIGGLFSIFAFLVRPIGIALPASVMPALFWRKDWRRAVGWAAAPVTVVVAAMCVLQVGIPRVLGALDWAAVRQDYLRWWFTIPMTDYLRWNVNVLFVSAFPFAPLLLPFSARWPRALHVTVAALALVGICRLALGELPMPLPDWQTWSLQDIAARAMVGGPLGPSDWSQRVAPAIRIGGLAVIGSLVVMLIRAPGSVGRDRGEAVVITLAVLHLALINVLWLYNDRYYTVLAPSFAIVTAKALDA